MKRFAITVIDRDAGQAYVTVVNVEDLSRLTAGERGGQQPISELDGRIRAFIGSPEQAMELLKHTGWKVTRAEDRKPEQRLTTAVEAIRWLDHGAAEHERKGA